MTDEKTTPDNADENAAIDDETVQRVDAAEVSAFEPAESSDAAADAGAVSEAAADEAAIEAEAATTDAEAFAGGVDAPEAEAAPVDEPAVGAAAAAPATAAEAPLHGVGPFSLREVVLGGVWLLAFIISFFPIYGGFGSGATVWNSGIDWVLSIGVPTAAVFLIALRRLSPQGIRRVGSLGIDQFASVAFSVSAVVWLGILWGAFVAFGDGRVFIATWVVWVEFFLMLAGVFLTVLAPFIAPFNEDFRHRPETVSHRAARPARPVTARPSTPAATPYAAANPAAATTPYAAANPYAASAPAESYATAGGFAPAAASTEAASAETGAQSFEPENSTTVIDQQSAQAAPAATQAFWALAPVERDVVDEQGLPLFTVGPTAWALVIEDRGDTFVVRHEDGRIGYLTDVSGVTRG